MTFNTNLIAPERVANTLLEMVAKPSPPDRSVHAKGLLMALGGSLFVTLGSERTSVYSSFAALFAVVGFARCSAYWRQISPKFGLPSFLGCLFMSFHFWMGVFFRFGGRADASGPMILAMATTILMVSLFQRIDKPGD